MSYTSLGQNTAEIYMAEALTLIVDLPKADGHP